MKVIFLEIDGVLNTTKDLLSYGSPLINQDLVQILKTIINKTRAKIVLSSSWRLDRESREMVKSSLSKKRLKFISCTPCLKPKKHQSWVNRCDEISAWLKTHEKIEKYVVLDEVFHAGLGFEDVFFKTDEEVGLTKDIADSIINVLNS